jgi:hypothetical protein
VSAPIHPTITTLDDVCDAVFTRDAPALVGFVAGDDGTYRLRDGPAFDLPEDLVGFRAPPAWDGLAVVVCGRARHLDRIDDPTRARVAFALARDGAYAGTVTTVDATIRLGSPAEPPLGHLADVCHRALGLPAAPEPSTPNEVISATWLADVLAAADVLGDGFDIDDSDGLLSLHPLGGRTSDSSWADLHEALVVVGSGWAGFSADDLAWMDPPTWARFVLNTVPPLPWLLDEIGRRASTATVSLVHTVVERGAGSVRGDRGGGG